MRDAVLDLFLNLASLVFFNCGYIFCLKCKTMKINRRRRERKTKESYSIAKKNLVSCQLMYFPRGKRHQILLSFSFSLSLYINMYIFIVFKMIFLCKSFSYCFGFSVLLQNAEAGARRCFKK